ncbi:MAG: hypothetical protein ACKVH0_01005 [Alphaproteobacteria bacterium]
MRDAAATLDPAKPRSHLLANMLASAFARKAFKHPADIDAALSAWQDAEAKLSGAPA